MYRQPSTIFVKVEVAETLLDEAIRALLPRIRRIGHNDPFPSLYGMSAHERSAALGQQLSFLRRAGCGVEDLIYLLGDKGPGAHERMRKRLAAASARSGKPKPGSGPRSGKSPSTRPANRPASAESRKARQPPKTETSKRPGRGRPSKVAEFRNAVRQWLEAKPDLSSSEILTRGKAAGYAGSKSAMFDLIAKLRPSSGKARARRPARRRRGEK